MDSESFIVYRKTYDICKDNAEDVKTMFGNSNYELDKLLPQEKN